MGDFGIGALKQAFYYPAMRIRFPENYPFKSHAWIQRLEVSQGFFDGLKFHFHPDMNCLVGGKAVGKSLLIELVRFVLGIGSLIDGINESSKAMITAKTCLGEDGTVILYVISENGEKYRIQRTVSDLDKGPEVYYEETETKASDNVKSIFQCQIYSQNEIIELGKNLPALLNWLDSFIDLSNEKQEIESIKKQVEKLFKQLDEDYAVAIHFAVLQKRKEELEEKKKLLDQKNKRSYSKNFSKLATGRTLIERDSKRGR